MSLFDKLKKKLPVFTIVSGNTVPVYNYPECMLVELGTDHVEHFVTEDIYAIAPVGTIFWLEVVSDEWQVMFYVSPY